MIESEHQRTSSLRTNPCDSEVQVHDVAADPVSSRTIWTCLLTQLRERVVCYVLMCRNIHCRSTSTPPQSMHLVRSILHLDVDRNLQRSDRCKSFRDLYLCGVVVVFIVLDKEICLNTTYFEYRETKDTR